MNGCSLIILFHNLHKYNVGFRGSKSQSELCLDFHQLKLKRSYRNSTLQEHLRIIFKSTINLVDGSSIAEKIIPFKSISGDLFSSPEIIGWQGNLLYFTMEVKLYALDVSTGEIIMQYSWKKQDPLPNE